MNDEQTKKNKKFAVGDLPPSPTTSTGAMNKRAVRHHVKRRSSGRVHVSKLAPMARAHNNEDTTATGDKPMKRSQSNKSLNRLSSLERKSTMTAFTPAHKNEEEEEETIEPHSPPTTPPPVNNTIIPPTLSNTTLVNGSPLKSQFVDLKNKSIATAAATSGMTRTQQKLLLQREQSLIGDENNIAHPKNMLRLTREMEKMGKEYRCVRKYQDPMMESLIRCQTSLSKTQPTLISKQVPHLEQRKQILLKTALQQQQQKQQQINQQEDDGWSASTFLERLFYGVS